MISLKDTLSKNTIMIVDDEPKNIQLLGTLLTQNNYNIIPAPSGYKAIEKLEKVKPDLILLDVMMPDMDGFETCRRIKANDLTKEIPVIFLTAKVDKDDVVNGLSAGAIDYITKPFSHKELLLRIKTQIDLINAHKEIANQMNATNELLHVLCHDLTNPIGSIASLLEVIETQEDLNELSPIMARSAEDCLEVITLVKAMCAIDIGKTVVCITRINLHDIINESISTLMKKFGEKDIMTNISIPEDTFVLAEKIALKNSIINNLLTNAIKFSPRGGTINIFCERVGDKIHLFIKDNGIGIPPELLKKIFHPGKSTSRKGTEGETGTGFGMPIVKKFMNKFDGDIEISSSTEAPSGTEIILKFVAC